VKRKVLEDMAKAYPELDYHNVGDGEIVHGFWIPYIEPKEQRLFCDDWAFCMRARNIGYKCWLDFGVRLEHRCDIWLGI
jgi:hypothetical protein